MIARELGVDLMPWQRHVLDVGGELLDDGRPAYQTVIVSVGRRAGKTLLILALLLRVALAGRSRRSWYTAQSRADAALTFRDEWVPAVQSSTLDPYIRARQSNGSESLAVPRVHSTVRIFAPTPTALHGQAGDLIVFDEAWAHTAERGAELEIAARPLMATRPSAQQWILSAAGDVDSGWWIDWLDRGRSAVELDAGTGVALLEWSADVPGLDLDDPAVWVASHPAVRTEANPAGTIPPEWLAAEHALNPDAFRRVYLNVTDRVGTVGSPIDPVLWARLAVDDWDRSGPIVAAVDVAPEQSSAVIVACGIDDVPVVEVVDRRPGIGWVAPRIAELCDRWNWEAVAVDRNGPAGAIFPELVALSVPVVDLAVRDVAGAAAGLVEAVRTGQIRHVASPLFDTAVPVARRRPVGDGSWTFSRTASTVDITPLIAAALARTVHPALYGAAPALYG